MRFLLENTSTVSDKIVTIFTLVALGVFFVLLIFFLFLDYKNIKSMEIRKMMYKNMQKLQKYEVTTVYSDKSKNYSGTEILPEPTKQSTAEHSFIFVGWDKNYINESGDTVAKAVFIKRVNTFIANFYDDDKTTLLKTEEVKYGEGIDTSAFEPVKAETKEFSFKFLCWNKDTTCIKKDETFYAVYDAYPKKYTYTFLDGDGETILSQKSSIFGTKIRPIPAPNCPDENFEFSHFENYVEDMPLEKNEVFTAVYLSKNGDGTSLFTPNRALAESLLSENKKESVNDYSNISSDDIISETEGIGFNFDNNKGNVEYLGEEKTSDVLIDKTSLLNNNGENIDTQNTDIFGKTQDGATIIDVEDFNNQNADAYNKDTDTSFEPKQIGENTTSEIDANSNDYNFVNGTNFASENIVNDSAVNGDVYYNNNNNATNYNNDNIYYNNVEMLVKNRANAEFVASQNNSSINHNFDINGQQGPYFDDKKEGVFVDKIEGENEFIDDNFVAPSSYNGGDGDGIAIRQDMVVAIPEKKQEMTDLEKAIKKPKQQTITTKKDGVVISMNVGESNIKNRLKKDSLEAQYEAEKKMNSRMMFQQNFSIENIEKNAGKNKDIEENEKFAEIKKDEGEFMRKISVFATQRRTENARNFSYNKPAKHYNAINFNDSKGSSVPSSIGGKVEHKISGEEIENELDNQKYQNEQVSSRKNFSSINLNTIASNLNDADSNDSNN